MKGFYVMNDHLVYEVALSHPYEEALNIVEKALNAEGFGIMTHVDAQATLKEKLGADFRSYSILGACHPPLARRLLEAEPKSGLLLPCKVTVEAADGNGSIVRFINPQMMVTLDISDSPVIAQVAQEAEERIQRIVSSLEAL